MTLAEGTIVGGYRVGEILGRGGMGVVYRAQGVDLDREVALKLLEHASPEFAERFAREGRLQASLTHPHAVTVYEAGTSEHGPYLAMRLVRGPTLAELLQARELDMPRAVTALEQVAGALDAIHAAGLVHRDIKPQNVLVQEHDAFLGDFGLVQDADGGGLTATGRVMGTLHYLAPELARGEPATPASDLYAFAATAFQCLTGAVVFPQRSEAAILFAHANEPPPRISARRPELPAGLDAVFAGALAKDAAARPASATAFVASVAQVLDAADARRLGPPMTGPTAADDETAAATPATAVDDRQGGATDIAGAGGRRGRSAADGRGSGGAGWRRGTGAAGGVGMRGRRGRGAALMVGGALAGAAVVLGIGALGGDDGSRPASAPVQVLRGATVLGSDLAHAGRTVDCRGRTVVATSPSCTLTQRALGNRTLVVPQDGVIRRWGVRSAHGEIALAVLRPREGGASQVSRSAAEFAENDGVSLFPTDLEVQRGDRLGIVVIGGSGYGVRATQAAAADRWTPLLTGTRKPNGSARGEVLLRAEEIPGADVRQPHQISGPAAAKLPRGFVAKTRDRTLKDGRHVEVRLVSVDHRFVVDALVNGRRTTRIDLPGFAQDDGEIRDFEVEIEGIGGELGVYVEYSRTDSARILNHFLSGFPNGLELVD